MRGPQKLSSFTNESTNAFEEGETTSENTSPVEVLVGSQDMFAMVGFVDQQFRCVFDIESELCRTVFIGRHTTCFASDNASPGNAKQMQKMQSQLFQLPSNLGVDRRRSAFKNQRRPLKF